LRVNNAQNDRDNGSIEVEIKFSPKGKNKNPLGMKDPNGVV